MQRYVRMLPAFIALGLSMSFFLAGGCTTTTRSSGLPAHIRSVGVEIFHNNTMYKGLEGRLTRAIIDNINYGASVPVSSNHADAYITGEITKVTRNTVRETTTDEPATVTLVVEATFSFYDEVEKRYIFEDVFVTSADTSSSAGLYEASRGESIALAEEGAVSALAREIVNRTIGVW